MLMVSEEGAKMHRKRVRVVADSASLGFAGGEFAGKCSVAASTFLYVIRLANSKIMLCCWILYEPMTSD